MKYFYKGSRHYYISFIAIFVLLVQVFSPIFDSGVFAEVPESKYFSISQKIIKTGDTDENSINEVNPGDSISVILDYQISVPSEGKITNVELTYTIPQELKFEGSNSSVTPDVNGNIVLTFNNGDQITEAISGQIIIELTVPNPSTNPNGTTILFDKAIFTGTLTKDSDSNSERKTSNTAELTLVVGESWIISKNISNANITIPKDTDIEYLNVDYTITLDGGNVRLKDLKLEDVIKSVVDDAPVSNIEISNVTGADSHEYISDEKKLKFIINDLSAKTSRTINYTVRYPIEGRVEGIDGITVGEYENSVVVTGATFYYDDSTGMIYFLTPSEASTSVTFVNSTAYWEVYRLEPEFDDEKQLYTREVIIPKDPNIITKQVSYTVGIRSVGEGNSDLGKIDLTEILSKEARFVPSGEDGSKTSNGCVYDSENHTVTWTLTNVDKNDSPTRTVTVEYTINRDSEQKKDNEVWVNKPGVINAITYANASDNVEIKLEKDMVDNVKVETEFFESEEYWNITKSTSSEIFYLKNNATDPSVTDYVEYTIKLEASNDGINNLDIESATIVDKLPNYVDYNSIIFPDGDPGIVNQTEGTITWQLSNIPADKDGTTYKYKLKYNKQKQDDVDNNDSNNTGVWPGCSLSNNVEIKDVSPGKLFKNGSGEYVDTDTASVTTQFKAPNAPKPTIDLSMAGYSSKIITQEHFDRDEPVAYKIKFSNPSNSNDYDEIENVVIDIGNDVQGKDYKVLSDKIDYEEIDLGASYEAGNVTLKYRKNNSTDWETAAISDGKVNLASLLQENEYLEALRIEYTKISKGLALTNDNCIKLTGNINDNANHGDLITNKAILNFKYRHYYYSNLLDGSEKSDYISFRVLLKTPWISALDKTKLTGDSDTEHNPSSESSETKVKFKILVENDGNLGTGPFIKPIIIDVVPKGFEYVKGSEEVKVTKISDSTEVTIDKSAYDSPEDEVDYVVDDDGNTILLWSWNKDLEIDTRMEIEYELKIEGTALGGKHTNMLYLSSGAVDQVVFWDKFKLDYISNNNNLPSLKSDAADGDIDKNSSTIEYLEGKHCDIIVTEISKFTVSKWVKGSLDTDFTNKTSDPNVGETSPGGSVDYLITIKNEGNIYGSWIEVVDILPYIGDTKVIYDEQRNTKWRPYFLIKEDILGSSTNSTRPGSGVELGTNEFSKPIKAKVEVEYSTAFDPIRYGKDTKERPHPPGPDTSTTIGTEEPNWFDQIPKDETRIQAIKFIISDFENSKGLEPGEEINLLWNMKTPVVDEKNIDSITYDKIAWNTASVHIQKNNVNGNKGMLYITEGPDAGIKLKKLDEQPQPSKQGEIGNFVWFDKNGNGTQDDGYDDESAGINGIKVKLYEVVEVDGEGKITKKNLIDETRTGPEYSTSNNGIGDPGYYSFPNLTVDKDYYVEFYIPNYYDVTVKGPGNEQDSDAKEETTINGDGFRVAQTGVITLSSEDKVRHDIDLGLIAAEEGKAELSLTKEAIEYKSLKNNNVSFDAPNTVENSEKKLITKTYSNAVNVGEIVTYRVTLQNNGDIPLHNIHLEDELNGFNFTDIRISDTQTKPITDDPRIIKISNGSLKLDKLDTGEKYIFEGIYEVLDSDLPGALTNTVKVWANELLDVPDKTPDNYAKQADAVIDIADLSLEKIVSRIIKKDTGEIIDASSVEGVGVEEGDTIVYRVILNNTGSFTLNKIQLEEELTGFEFTNVVVSDEIIPITDDTRVTKTSDELLNLDKLDANEQYVFEGTFTVPAPTGDNPRPPITNTVTASDDGSIRKDLSATINVYYKGLQVIKKVSKIKDVVISDGDLLVVNIGDEIEYEITLTNDGDALLKNVTIQDILTSSKGQQDKSLFIKDENDISYSPLDLGVGESKTFTLIYNVSEDDIAPSNVETSRIKNKVVVKSNYIEKTDNSQDVDIAYLDIKKTADKTTYYVGQAVNYSITITNKGTIALNNVEINDPMLKEIKLNEIEKNTIDKLIVGESATFTGSYIVTEEDLAKGKIENIATADSDETEEISDDCTVTVRRKSSGGSGGGGGSDEDEDEDKTPEPEPDPEPQPQPVPQPQPIPQPQPQPEPVPQSQPEPEVTPDTPEDTGEIVKDEDDVPTYIPPKDKEVVEIVEQPEHGTVKKDDDGNVKYIPEEGYKGPDKFKVKVKDDEGNELILEIEIPDEEIPQGTIKILPQTGEGRYYPYYLFGLAILLLGVFMNLQGFVKKFKL